jgi:hypothetical protein
MFLVELCMLCGKDLFELSWFWNCNIWLHQEIISLYSTKKNYLFEVYDRTVISRLFLKLGQVVASVVIIFRRNTKYTFKTCGVMGLSIQSNPGVMLLLKLLKKGWINEYKMLKMIMKYKHNSKALADKVSLTKHLF